MPSLENHVHVYSAEYKNIIPHKHLIVAPGSLPLAHNAQHSYCLHLHGNIGLSEAWADSLSLL